MCGTAQTPGISIGILCAGRPSLGSGTGRKRAAARAKQGNRIETVLRPPVRSRGLIATGIVPSSRPASAGNGLLAALPRKDRLHIIAGSDEVDLVLSDVLCAPGDRMRHVYFPTDGFVSLVAPIDASSHLEVGLVGSEGMIGTPLVLGVATSPLQALVQGAGSALRMGAASFQRELAQCPALRDTLDRYLYVRMTQLANAVACNRFHVVESRLARWLLMTQDRARSNALHITHEFLSSILGVRRVGVTKAATSLQKLGLISYSRGNITILDRPGLMTASCGCYQADLETYDDILG
jgi:CRP-like cAMP-binding protein